MSYFFLLSLVIPEITVIRFMLHCETDFVILLQGLGLQVVKYLAAKYEELGCEVKWMGKPDKVI